MNKTIKQLDFNEAVELTKAGEQVLAITVIKKPTIKAFRNLLISEAISGNYIFQYIEGGSDE